MPTTYTHYKFGKEVLSQLPKPLHQSIESDRELYDIGLHGPDILFYYNVLKKNKVSSTGYGLHEKYADIFFENAGNVIAGSKDKAAARAYIYGFICHFALDSECHNYIEKMIQVSGISHAEIEMELDRLLLTEDGIDPVSYLGTGHVHPTEKNAEVIAPFFEDISAKEVKKALSSMISIHKLLLAPNPKKRKLLFRAMKLAGMYESNAGLVMSLEPNPDCVSYCQILKRQFDHAAPIAAELILQYQKVIFDRAEMPERFHETFGAGEHWEELQL